MSLKGSITTSDYLPFEDYQKLVQALINDKEYWWCTYCILAFCTGLRFSDIKKLKWGDVLNQKVLTVKEQKTGKTRSIPIGNNAAQHLTKLYSKLGRPNMSSYIMNAHKTEDGEPVSIQYVNHHLKKWISRYDLDIVHFSTHTFRKTFGRYVYEKAGRTNDAIVYLNRIFRHTSLSTTMIYLGIRDDEIAGIFNSIEI